MTIGWGSIGVYWGKKVLVVPVRLSRFTYGLIKDADNFTVSVPKYNEIAKSIAYCGVNSGREMDKIAESGLTTVPAKKVDTPIIKEAYLHYECNIIAKQDIDNNHFNVKYMISGMMMLTARIISIRFSMARLWSVI